MRPVRNRRHPLTGEIQPEAPYSPTGTYWNGLPTLAERGTAVVADSPEFPEFWARREGIIGQRIPVVRVVLDGVNYGGGIDFLDDREGSGWRKVTNGHGSPAYGHRSLDIEPGTFRALLPESAAPDDADGKG